MNQVTPHAPIRSYRDLLVWQKSIDLVVDCYRATEPFPRTETYGLVSQVRRAATAIPANIAEGHGRDHLGDYLRHVSIAKGSLTELETHLIISERLSFVSKERLQELLERTAEVGRMLEGLSKGFATGSAVRTLEPETWHLEPSEDKCGLTP